jgi:hypothetical protein
MYIDIESTFYIEIFLVNCESALWKLLHEYKQYCVYSINQ